MIGPLPAVGLLTASFVAYNVGDALFVGNLTGAPSSTSVMGVGAIGGFGVAADELDLAVSGEIVPGGSSPPRSASGPS